MQAQIIYDTFTKKSGIPEESKNKLWWVDIEKIGNIENVKTTNSMERDIKECPTFTKIINWSLIPDEELRDYYVIPQVPFYITKKEGFLEDFIELQEIKINSLKINVSNAEEIDEMGFRINTDYIIQRKKTLEQLKLQYGIK